MGRDSGEQITGTHDLDRQVLKLVRKISRILFPVICLLLSVILILLSEGV